MVKIYLASLDMHSSKILPLIRKVNKTYFNLFSYYYLKNSQDIENYKEIRNYSVSCLVDSGAHSFQKGTSVNYDKFIKKYIKFIENTDSPKTAGYFELDVDNIVGYDTVKEYRKLLEEVSDKTIPVWHKNRGISDFKDMCKTYDYVSISGWKNEDIHDTDFKLFVDYAHKQGCKIHGLGMTRVKVLDTVNFDSVDSSSWTAPLRYRCSNKNFFPQKKKKLIKPKYANESRIQFEQICYIKGIRLQEKYATEKELRGLI